MSQLAINKVKKREKLKHLINRLVLIGLVVLPVTGMGFLSLTILAPALTNPEARFYGSSKGYPAKQRTMGQAIEPNDLVVEKVS